jgi:hypothetical protein
MKDQADDKQFSEEEIALRMNNAVRRALNTPPKPLKSVPKTRRKNKPRQRSEPKKG